MSIKKNALAVALVAGLGLAGVAAAYTIQTNNDDTPERIATADITSASTAYTMNELVDVEIDTTDFILGRTTGFNVRVSLVGGARYETSTTPITIVPGSALPAGWTVTQAAGGDEQNFVVFSVTPPDANAGSIPGIQPGQLFRLDNVTLDNLTSLQTAGGQVTAQADFIDPVGATVIGADSVVILQSGNPVALGCDPDAGDTNTRVDVGQSETVGSKTRFSSTGEIGLLDETTIDLGDINVSSDPAFSSFAYQATDSFTTVVSGDFSAFAAAGNSVYLSNDECATAITATRTINGAADTVTFTYTAANAGFGATGGDLQLCASVAPGNTTVIDASSVSVRTTFNRTGVPAVTSAACSLLPLQYNGSVVRVYHVNPAGNSTAQSFVRVINQSSTDGRVTIVGVDDAGNSRGPISFVLGAQESMQINSNDLEAGNTTKGFVGSLGDGVGKWRLFVTGEFSGMVVQSLNRNATDGTVTNLTDADTRGEQVLYDVFEGGGGGPL